VRCVRRSVQPAASRCASLRSVKLRRRFRFSCKSQQASHLLLSMVVIKKSIVAHCCPKQLKTQLQNNQTRSTRETRSCQLCAHDLQHARIAASGTENETSTKSVNRRQGSSRSVAAATLGITNLGCFHASLCITHISTHCLIAKKAEILGYLCEFVFYESTQISAFL